LLPNRTKEKLMTKRNRIVALVVCLAAILVVAWSVPAQDPLKVAPKNSKLLLENDRVRVVKSAKVKFTTPDGKSQEVEMKAGQAVWGDPTTHMVEFLGPGDAHVIVLELKGPATAPAKKAM
jgi:hypothetical protein